MNFLLVSRGGGEKILLSGRHCNQIAVLEMMMCSILEMEWKNNQLRLTERHSVINTEQRERKKKDWLSLLCYVCYSICTVHDV